jgi:hypothetical protein
MLFFMQLSAEMPWNACILVNPKLVNWLLRSLLMTSEALYSVMASLGASVQKLALHGASDSLS